MQLVTTSAARHKASAADVWAAARSWAWDDASTELRRAVESLIWSDVPVTEIELEARRFDEDFELWGSEALIREVVEEVRAERATRAAQDAADVAELDRKYPVPEKTLNPSPPRAPTWAAPLPFDDVGRLPTFPLEALPPVLRDWVEAEATATQTPIEMSAALVLGVLSAVTAKRFEVRVTGNWVEQLSLYFAIAMAPGERKTQTFRDACRPLRDWEADKAQRMSAQIIAARTERTILEKRLEGLTKKAAKGGQDAADVGQEAQELAIELAETPIPVAPLVSADDVTPEQLAKLMHDHGGRMAVMSAEGGIFDTVAGRYSDGVANIEALLKGHAGDDLRVDRVNRAPLHIRKPALSMCICTQPEVIQGLALKPTFRGRGLLARFMFVLPGTKMGSRDVAAPPMPAQVAQEYAALIGDLLNSPVHTEPTGEIKSTQLELSPEALAKVREFARELEPRLGPGGDLEQIQDWASKATGAMVRIAGLLHLGGAFESFESFELGVVERKYVDESEKILLFFLSHALAAFRVMGMDASVGQARKLLNWIEKNNVTTFTRRDAQQKHRALFRTPAEIDPALKVLEDHGYIRQAATPPTGGRPSSSFEVNPSTQKPQKPQKGWLH